MVLLILVQLIITQFIPRHSVMLKSTELMNMVMDFGLEFFKDIQLKTMKKMENGSLCVD